MSLIMQCVLSKSGITEDLDRITKYVGIRDYYCSLRRNS